ncbi:MAG: hypothetical protein Q9227_003091 [Pyrenula ochraceoflavens]
MEVTASATRSRIPWLTRLTDQAYLRPEMLAADYEGDGSEDQPYVVAFMDDDPTNPLGFAKWTRWGLCLAASYVTFTVAFNSSAFVSGITGISRDLGGGPELAMLGVGVFLIGFILGPLVWAPTSEMYGRQHVLLLATAIQVVANIALCFSQNLPTVFVLRFFSGAFGAAPLTGAAAVIADTFPPRQRGLAVTVYALVPLLAPVLGPMIGEYVVGISNWRWLMALMALLSGSALVVAALVLPETYAPVLLRKRAAKMSSITGCYYVSSMDVGGNGKGAASSQSWKRTLFRPFLLVAHEPIIVVLALYQAVVFGTLYLTIAAFPIAYTELRGWPQEQSGISFVGVLTGVLLAAVFQIWDSSRYSKLVGQLGPEAALPEARLQACCGGGISIIVGLFWFALTADPSIHWIINTAAGIPFGFGTILVTIGTTNYLIDTYTVFAASAVAVCIITRALCGAVFPLFVRVMFANLGIFWTLSIPGLFCLLFAPVPFILLRYGPALRRRSKHARQEKSFGQTGRRATSERTRLLSTPAE